ncbi:MAG: 3-hydroxyacyl-[acyl-carrier-protein] dehydratase FabZ [Gemmatimonadaceae bacterium]
MGPTDIMAVLAHRYPILLVDRIDVLEAGRRVEGRKQITGGEWQMWGGIHAAMPSMLVVEALAQTSAALLLGLVESTVGVIGYFAGIERVRMREPAVPGDTLVLSVELSSFRRGVARLKGIATVDGRRVVSASFTTIVRPVT